MTGASADVHELPGGANPGHNSQVSGMAADTSLPVLAIEVQVLETPYAA